MGEAIWRFGSRLQKVPESRIIALHQLAPKWLVGLCLHSLVHPLAARRARASPIGQHAARRRRGIPTRWLRWI